MATQSCRAYMEGKRGNALVENSTHGNKIMPATSVKKRMWQPSMILATLMVNLERTQNGKKECLPFSSHQRVVTHNGADQGNSG